MVIVLCLTDIGQLSAKQPLIVAGTGDSQQFMRLVADHYMKEHPDFPVQIPDSIGSGGGIKGLINGKFPLARTARPLKEKEQDGTLIEYPFAVSPVVLVVHPSVSGVRNLTTEQIIGIYAGKITRWDQVGGPTMRIYPVDREPGDSSRKILEENLAGFRETQSIAKVFFNTPEALDAIANHQYTVGFLPFAVAQSRGLKILTIDGIAPSEKNVVSGRYPYITTFYLISRGEPTTEAQRFISYLYNDQLLPLYKESGLIPVKPGASQP